MSRLKAGGRPAVYLTYSTDNTPSSMLIRTSGDPANLVSAAKQRIVGFG